MIKLALILAMAAVAGLILACRAYSRRLDTGRTRAQQLDAAAIAAYRAAHPVIVSLPPERTMVEIAAPRTRAELTLEEWMAESEPAILRAEVNELMRDLAVMSLKLSGMAEDAADRLAKGMGYASGVTDIRAAELIAEAHGDRGELVEKIQEAVPWDMAAELDAEPDLSDDALAAIITAWAAQVSA